MDIVIDEMNEGQKDGAKNGQLGGPKDGHQTGQMLATRQTVLLDYREKIQVGLQEEKIRRREEQNFRRKKLWRTACSHIRLSIVIDL